MNDLNNKFSIRRVRCLFSYYSKQWKEGFLYLPLAYLSIGVLHIIQSVLIGNPKSIDNNDLSAFVNVINFHDKAFGLQIFKIAFLVFIFFQLFSIITKKEKSTFFRSIPATSFEKFSFLILEYLYLLLLMISIQIFSIFLDGMVCTLSGYNEWSDILPAIKSYFTPEIDILNNGFLDYGRYTAKLLDDSWLNNRLFVWGVSFNKIMSFTTLMMLGFVLISISKNPKVISRKRMKLLNDEAFVKKLSYIIAVPIVIFFFWPKIDKLDFSFISGFGPWCYNLEYGWMIHTLVLMMWHLFWIYLMYYGIKKGEAK